MRLLFYILTALLSSTQYFLLTQAWQCQWRLGPFPLSSKRSNGGEVQTENFCKAFVNGAVDPSRSRYFQFNVDSTFPDVDNAPVDEYLLHQFIVWRDTTAGHASGDDDLDGFLFYPPSSDSSCRGDPTFYLWITVPVEEAGAQEKIVVTRVQDAHIDVRLPTPLGYYRAVYRNERDTIYPLMTFPEDAGGRRRRVNIKHHTSEDGVVHGDIVIPMQRMRPTAFYAREFGVDVPTIYNSDIYEEFDPRTQKTVRKLAPVQDFKDLIVMDWSDPLVQHDIDSMHDLVLKQGSLRQVSNRRGATEDDPMDLEEDEMKIEVNKEDALEKMDREQNMASLKAYEEMEATTEIERQIARYHKMQLLEKNNQGQKI